MAWIVLLPVTPPHKHFRLHKKGTTRVRFTQINRGNAVFTPVILACTFVLTQECLRFEDTRGPYATEERCIERIVEMTGNIRTISPELRIARTACLVTKGVPT